MDGKLAGDAREGLRGTEAVLRHMAGTVGARLSSRGGLAARQMKERACGHARKEGDGMQRGGDLGARLTA